MFSSRFPEVEAQNQMFSIGFLEVEVENHYFDDFAPGFNNDT